jgi:hypothetical protein
MRYLDDSHHWVRHEALHVLETLGPIAAAAVPALEARKAHATGLDRELLLRALSAVQKVR